jgi:hypothetical protein
VYVCVCVCDVCEMCLCVLCQRLLRNVQCVQCERVCARARACVCVCVCVCVLFVPCVHVLPHKKREQRSAVPPHHITWCAAGLEDGVLPNKWSEDEEEERRLAYVGCTRAKRTLELTWRHRHMGYHRLPSPYLDDLRTAEYAIAAPATDAWGRETFPGFEPRRGGSGDNNTDWGPVFPGLGTPAGQGGEDWGRRSFPGFPERGQGSGSPGGSEEEHSNVPGTDEYFEFSDSDDYSDTESDSDSEPPWWSGSR